MKTHNTALLFAAAALCLAFAANGCRTPKDHDEHPNGDHPAAHDADSDHPDHPEHPKGEHPK